MIVWLEKRLVLLLHDRQIAEHGGLGGLRDESLLQSALARPQPLYASGAPPPDLAELVASLAYGIAKNHAFVDGNKRSAFVSYRTFLALNHAQLDAAADEKYTTILALAEGRLSEAAFADWLRSRLVLDIGDDGVQEREPRYQSVSTAKKSRRSR